MRALPLFSLGLLLGAAASWLFLSPGTPSPGSASALPAPGSSPLALPSWSWRDSATPAALSSDTASAAIAAWLDLRGPDGAPADFALRVDALRALLIRLPADAFPRLVGPLAGARKSDQHRLRQIAFDAWVGRDPAAAARWSASAPDALDLARQAARAWARLDAPAAAEWACSLRDEKTARALAAETLRILAENDPARALALATGQGEDFLDEIIPSLIEPLAKTDPAAALLTYGPRLWKQGNGFWRLREAISTWTARDPSAALAWLVAQPRTSDGELSNWLGNLAGEENRALIASAIATVPGLPNRQAALGHLLFSWGAEHPDEAVAWLDSLSDRDLRTALLERASHITYSEHPEKSLPLALAMPEGANRNQRLSDLLGQWAKNDPAAALAWLGAHPEPGVAAASAEVHAAILGSIARDEPATALDEWRAIADPRTKSAAIEPIAQAWARSDPAAALQWAAEQEATLKINKVHEALIYAWSQKEPLAALRWAEARPDAEQQNNYLASLSGTWNEKAPRASTADLFAQIKDPALRTAIVFNHVREWLTKDPAAAKTWLESHDALPPEAAARLLAQIESTSAPKIP